MAVISIEEVEPFLPAALTMQQRTMVEDLIDLVEGELKEVLNRPIEVEKFVDEEHVVNLVEPTLYLRNVPVVSVEAATADGNAVDAAFYTVRSWGLDFGGFNTLAINDPVIWTPSNAHFTWWQTPDIQVLASGSYPQSIWKISYTAGIDGATNNAIRSILIKAVRRQIGEIFRGYNGVYSRIKVEDFEMSQDTGLLSKMVGSFTEPELRLLSSLIHKSIS